MHVSRHHFTLIDSTNNWGKQNLHLFSPSALTLVTAEAQSAGRGRFKRRWESPAGQNIYASFCFVVDSQRRDIGNIPQVLALSAAKVLENSGFSPQLKWPNDVLLAGKKVAGLLAETTSLDAGLGVVIGIGLNVNMPLELLEQIDRPATSLCVESGHPFDVEEILSALQRQFLGDLELFLVAGFTPFLEEYRCRLPMDGQLIRFHDNQRIWEGVLVAINDDGSLNLRLADGVIKRFIAGEILWPSDCI